MRTFGVEIETFGPNKFNVAAAISEQVTPCAVEGYNHDTRNHWKIVPDASVPDGFEVVSPVLQGDEGLQQVVAVCRVLNEQGCRINRSCGLHVHVGARDLNAAEVATIMNRYAAYENEIDAFMPVSRRATNNPYCQPAPRVRMNAPSVAAIAGSAERMCKVNLTAYLRHGTIEFRQHSGSTNGDKITNWVRFVLQFVEASRAIANGGGASESRPTPARMGTKSYRAWVVAFNACSDRGYFTHAEVKDALGWNEAMRTVRQQAKARGWKVVTTAGGNYRLVEAPAQGGEDRGLFHGIANDVQSFYAERAQELA